MSDFTFDVERPVDDTLAPEGSAIVQLCGIDRRVSNAGNDMFVWDFTIVQYQHPGLADTKTDNLHLKSMFTALSAKAAWKLQETLDALGVDTGDGGKIKGTFDAAEIIGTLCLANIVHEEYNGQTGSSINSLAPHPDGAGKKAPISAPADPFDTPF